MTGPQTIDVPTLDGVQPAKAFAPAGRPKGGVIVYMDAFGWRDELDAMAARYAAAGWLTFLPDLFHRLGRVRFPPPAGAHLLDPAMHAANSATTIAMTVADTGALLAFAGERWPEVRRFGVVGYCMGARHALAAAAFLPESVVAAACLHGGRMVTTGRDSPHLFIGKAAGALYFGFAKDDETCPPAHQATIERRIRRTKARAGVEHFDAAHGWTFPSRWAYDHAAAERAFARVLALFEDEVAGRHREA